MALSIKDRRTKDGGGARVKPGKRLCLTKDGSQLVPFGHALGASLYCTEYSAVDEAEYKALLANGTPDEPKVEPAADKGPPKTGKPKAKKAKA